MLSGDSVLPDIPVAFLLSVHSPPVPGSYFTLHLITYVLTLLGKEKQTEEDYNMFPLSNLLPPLHLTTSIISFQLWWIASLWSYQRNPFLVHWLPSPFACVRMWFIELSISSECIIFFCITSFPPTYMYFDSHILLQVPLHFSVPLRGGVQIH